ncbi:MAG: acyl-CoA dehydrogenase family protein, partial [Solirubrobacteraceae bacterium]
MAVHTDEAPGAQRVTDAIAVVAEHAAETAALARPADAAIVALDAAGLFRLSWPEVYGGPGASVAAQRDVVAAVAEVDGSVSWVTSVYNAVNGMIWIMDDRAHEEFLNSETPRSAGVFAPTGTFRRADGGFVLSGKWAFATGQHHAGWILVAAVPQDGGPPSGFLVPKSEFTVIDNWQVSGLVGTGSNSVSLTQTFVPDHREVAFGDIVAGDSHSETLAHDTRIHQPFVPFMCAVSVGTPLGLARHALGLFGQRIHGRGITYTIYKDQAAAPLTHLQLAP